MMPVDFRQIALVCELFDTQSLRQAAEHMHVTPSAASQSLQRMRDTLEDDLLVRHGSRYVLTPFGEGALDSFREMVRIWDEASSGAGFFDPGTCSLCFSIACDDSFTEIDLSALYAAMVL